AGKKVLKGRALTALKPDRDARALAQELRAAFTFAQWGWDVEFTDLENRGRYDYIVRKGAFEVEIECKAVTADCGNAVHREPFDDFTNDTLRHVQDLDLENVFARVDIALESRLPNDRTTRAELMVVVRSLLAGPCTSARVGDTQITLRRLPPDVLSVGGANFQ